MRLVPSLPGRLISERWQKLAGEFAKFGTVGLINTVINYAVFNALILTVFAAGQLKANVVATVVATTASYFMNRHWTYRDRAKSALKREYLLFFVFNLAGLMIELGVLALSKYGLGLTSLLALNVAKTLGLGLGTVFRFWAYRTFVFPVSLAPVSSAPASVQGALLGSGPSGADLAAGSGLAAGSAGSGLVPAGAGSAPGVVPVQPLAVEREFDDLTAPLEAEWDDDLDVELAVELDPELGTEATPGPRR